MWTPEKPFNDLPPLPPKGVAFDTSEIHRALVASHRTLAELKQATRRITNPGILIDSLGLREAQSSSEIENIVTTGDELFRAFSDKGERTDAATKEVLRYRDALYAAHMDLRAGRPLATVMFEKINQTVRNTIDGVRRVPGTKILNAGTGEVIYTPPEGESLLREKLARLEKFIYGAEDIDPLIKLALVHYQFEAIHPFSDGNGRTGRIINLLYLVEAELLTIPVLFLSGYVLTHKADYYSGLLGVTRDNDWHRWVGYMLEAVRFTAADTLSRIDAILALQLQFADRLRSKLPKIYSLELVQLLFANPYTKIEFLVRAEIAKRQTASKYLDEIAKLGLLVVIERGREKYFVNRPLIDVLGKP